ncbi:glycerophosphodiester phosphodiesterase family protein [Sphingomonadaceae bacterium jetA1]|jgi:glycerophosphoryl diester phosphodiesterase|uniref:glycerophosphodiester phosphodiesterase family protein n=1 Tax=Facivitalis istanbulensis TaxID=3075838 RepID=UPI0034757A42
MIRPLFSLALACFACSVAQASPSDVIRRIRDPRGGLIVASHRGCHEAAPHHGWGTVPENSRAALMRCTELGIDIMETDVRRSRDGHLVIMHDDRVDRTTEGKGKVADLTLAGLKALHLRDDEGGASAALTDERILTLDELLALAKDRIVLNLDVKDSIYAEVVDAVCEAGAQDRVIVKTFAGIASPPLAGLAPYRRVPFMVIPTSADADGSDIPEIIARQMSGRVKPIAVELPYIPARALPGIAARAEALKVPLWVNTLWGGFVIGAGGDVDALRDPGGVWGAMAKRGVRLFQTDETEAFVRYRATLAKASVR